MVSEAIARFRFTKTLCSHCPFPPFSARHKVLPSVTYANLVGVSQTASENGFSSTTTAAWFESTEQTVSRLLTRQIKLRSSGDQGPAWTSKSSFQIPTPC